MTENIINHEGLLINLGDSNDAVIKTSTTGGKVTTPFEAWYDKNVKKAFVIPMKTALTDVFGFGHIGNQTPKTFEVVDYSDLGQIREQKRAEISQGFRSQVTVINIDTGVSEETDLPRVDGILTTEEQDKYFSSLN